MEAKGGREVMRLSSSSIRVESEDGGFQGGESFTCQMLN